MTINDKIKQILIEQNFTPSYFADEIGIQRSSISHILSGRNRPSFDVIQKIIRRFPELGYEWIMEEETQSTMNPSPAHKNRQSVNRSNEGYKQVSPAARTNQSALHHFENPAPTTNQPRLDNSIPVSILSPVTNDAAVRKAERIIVFYTDGSFQEYIPSS